MESILFTIFKIRFNYKKFRKVGNFQKTSWNFADRKTVRRVGLGLKDPFKVSLLHVILTLNKYRP
jgi:hypothetical protein